MSAPRLAGDEARATVLVKVPVEVAFRVFTEQIDEWWRRGPAFRIAGKRRGFIRLEPGLGGRLYESFESDTGERVLETGQVIAWEPPGRLAFEWRAVNFAPAERTWVEVVFEASASGTLVTVIHRGWAKIRADHPVRHGLDVGAFLRMMGLFWGDLVTSLRHHAEASSE